MVALWLCTTIYWIQPFYCIHDPPISQDKLLNFGSMCINGWSSLLYKSLVFSIQMRLEYILKFRRGWFWTCSSLYYSFSLQENSYHKLILKLYSMYIGVIIVIEFFCEGVKIEITRGCPIIIRTGILLHTSKTIAPRVKSQARGQNNWSRALKWGIVHLCSSNTFGDTTKFMKV